jgi:hypothetical protein
MHEEMLSFFPHLGSFNTSLTKEITQTVLHGIPFLRMLTTLLKDNRGQGRYSGGKIR